MGVITGLEPAKVFEYFEEICGIPHGSTDTKRISDHIAEFARGLNLECIQDENNNLIIRKPGSEGYEKAPMVMLQGHLDMVCEKEEGVDFDFKTEGLKLKLENGIISAEGTTLGGDDGIAVAYCMALLASKDIPHPPLEVILTSDEEIGMLGAAAMDMSQLRSKILINIDSEEEGILLAGCAGGVLAKATLPIKRKFKAGIPMQLKIEGLLGGHSGNEIDKGRANADKLLGRILFMASKETDFNLISVSGGTKDNAIPRSAIAELTVAGEMEMKKLTALTDIFTQMVSREYEINDPDIRVSIKEITDTSYANPMDDESTRKVITMLTCLPNGIEKMSFSLEGLVETSLNLGILETSERDCGFSFLVRSSVESEKEELVDRIQCLTGMLGGSVELSGNYPGWDFKKESKLRDLFVSVFEELYGHKPEVEAIHAGLECGLFAGGVEGLDVISLGPDMKDIHTPSESMDAESVKRTWDYLLAVLKRIDSSFL